MKIAAILAGVAAAVGGVIAIAWTQQRKLLYFPDGDPGPPPPPWETVSILTESGLDLAAWYRPSLSASSPLVVLLPGNGGSRAGRLGVGDALAAHDLAVLLVDYRGYGGNPGQPSERGLADDARSAARLAAELAIGRPIVYLGESLGAAVATGLATEIPPAALVLASPFTTLADVGRFHYPWVLPMLMRDRFPSLHRFQSGALQGIPILVVAGTADRVVPVAQSRAIAEAAGAELYEVEGADHNEPPIRSDSAVIARIARFVEEAVSTP
jgi:uncharacterized protein